MVHDLVPPRNDRAAAPACDLHRPGYECTTGDTLSRHTAYPGRHSEHADLRAVEVDVQLPGGADKPFSGQHTPPVHYSERAAMARRDAADASLNRSHGGLVGPR